MGDRSRGTGRRARWIAVALLGALLAGCQFLQNEFFFLDAARPPQPAAENAPPW